MWGKFLLIKKKKHGKEKKEKMNFKHGKSKSLEYKKEYNKQ